MSTPSSSSSAASAASPAAISAGDPAAAVPQVSALSAATPIPPEWANISFAELLARLLADRQRAAPSGPLAAAEENIAAPPGLPGPAALLKDPPLFEAKLTLPAFMAWKDKFLLFARRGGRTSAESAIASGNAHTLRAYWFTAKQSLPDLPGYDEAKAALLANLDLPQQERWLSLLEQVIRFNTCSEQPVRPRFDSFRIKWEDESTLDLEDLASATRLRCQNPDTYDTEDHFQASVSEFRRELEVHGFKSISADMGHHLGAQRTEAMSAAERGALLTAMMETFEHRLHQAMRVIRDHKAWLVSPAADVALQRATSKATAAAVMRGQQQQQQQQQRQQQSGKSKAQRSSNSSVKKTTGAKKSKMPLRLKGKSSTATASATAASN